MEAAGMTTAVVAAVGMGVMTMVAEGMVVDK